MAKMKAMGLTFLYKDMDLKKKTEVTKIAPGAVGSLNKRTLNFGVFSKN